MGRDGNAARGLWWGALALVVGAASAPGCSEISDLIRNVGDSIDEARSMLRNVNEALAATGSGGMSVTSVSPLGEARIEGSRMLPARIEANIPTGSASGRRGMLELDVDGDGASDQVSFFVDDAGQSCIWGQEEEEDLGDVCWFAWEESDGSLYYLYEDCDAEDDFVIACTGTSDETWQCDACNDFGCLPCTEDACELPEGPGDDGDTTPDELVGTWHGRSELELGDGGVVMLDETFVIGADGSLRGDFEGTDESSGCQVQYELDGEWSDDPDGVADLLVEWTSVVVTIEGCDDPEGDAPATDVTDDEGDLWDDELEGDWELDGDTLRIESSAGETYEYTRG